MKKQLVILSLLICLCSIVGCNTVTTTQTSQAAKLSNIKAFSTVEDIKYPKPAIQKTSNLMNELMNQNKAATEEGIKIEITPIEETQLIEEVQPAEEPTPQEDIYYEDIYYEEVYYDDSYNYYNDYNYNYNYDYNYVENGDGLTQQGGVNYYDGRTETYYSSNVLYHQDTADWTVDEEGFYRTDDGYYVVAASDVPQGSTFEGSKGTCIVLDTGCAGGVTDYYVAW